MLDAAQRATAICADLPLPPASPQPPAQGWTQGLWSWCCWLSVSCLWRSRYQAFCRPTRKTEWGITALSITNLSSTKRKSLHQPRHHREPYVTPKTWVSQTRHYLHSPRWHKFKHPEGNGEIGILITKVTVTWVGALVKCVKLWCIDISECVLGVFGLWSWKMPK